MCTYGKLANIVYLADELYVVLWQMTQYNITPRASLEFVGWLKTVLGVWLRIRQLLLKSCRSYIFVPFQPNAGLSYRLATHSASSHALVQLY